MKAPMRRQELVNGSTDAEEITGRKPKWRRKLVDQGADAAADKEGNFPNFFLSVENIGKF